MEASAFATFSESPSLEALCTLLQLPQDRVVCAYQFGSRVWQTADATSDWDYRLVIDGWQGPEHLDERCPFIDACAYSPDEWWRMMHEHDMLTLLCLYLPPHHVLKEEVKWTGPQLGRGGWRLSLKKLVRGVIKERNKAWDKAKRLYAEYEAGVERQEAGKGQGGLRMVKKNLAHGIRYLVLGRALAERGAIDDFAAANHYYHQLMAHRGDLECSGDKSSAWDRWEARYRPVYQQLERQFRELVESEIGGAVAQQLRREEACRQQQHRQWPAVVDYLRESVAAQQVTGRDDTDAALESALSALTRVFAIQISRHPQSSRLYHFRYDREDSPLSLQLTRECNGLILEIGRVVAAAAHDDNEGLRVEVACRPPRRSYNTSRRFKEPTDAVLQRLDWSRVQVHDLLQGSTIFLYRGGAGWLMSTPRSVDAEVEWLGATTTPPSLAQQFWRAWQRHGCRLPDDLSSQRRTFVFKLWQRNNDLGSEHGELMFVGASDAGDDAAVELAERHGWPYVSTLRADLTPDGDATSDGGGAAERQQLVLRRLRRDLMALDPWRDPRKGLVVSGPSREEADDVRVKFVSPQHAVLKRLRRAGRGEMPKDSVELDALMLDMVRTNDCHEDLLAALPHLRACYLEVADDYHQVCGKIQAAFDAVASVARDQKAFAQGAAAHKRHKTVLLQMRKEGYANVREYLFAQSLPGVVYILSRCSTRPSWRGQQ